ncbi:MAG: flagellar hook-basal body protein [Candidatus Krumholzibacteriia bacterium]
MLRSLRTAEEAMNLRLTQIDALANNLANVDATGFKQVLTRVTERGADGTSVQPYPDANPAGVVNPVGLTAAEALAAMAGGGGATGAPAAGAGTAVGGTWARSADLAMTAAIDNSPGPLRDTGRMTDFAIDGRGYFVVQTAQGEQYTRDGHFTVDAAGRLVTADGSPVLGTGGPVEIDANAPFAVDRDGSVLVNGSVAARLQVVDFPDPSRLQHRGDARLAAPSGVTAQPLSPEQVEVVQGQLEGSNVDPVLTMVAMISAQRAFEIESRLMQATDENLDKAVNQLPAVR